MDFEAQVESLTGLTISSSGTTPTQAELTQFLSDGVCDVINKMIDLKPEELHKFSTTTHDASNSGIIYTGRILSVMREHDSTSILRSCDPINASDRYDATDNTSLKFRSKTNPGYYILNQKIFTVPVSAGSDNDAVVTQVTYDTGLAYTDSSIDNFPTEYEYLVPMYAAIKSLEAKMAEYTIDEEDIELVQAIAFNLNSLKQQYESEIMGKAQPKGQTNEG
jgi:hypothetical protein|tara:strand:+ start:323 stop:985 length:663 start_codon:yes stop_codon:yes gene_type:complete